MILKITKMSHNEFRDQMTYDASKAEEEDEFNEVCDCGTKMSNEKLTEEEYDEHEDREVGIKYIKGECGEDTEAWYCKEHREEEVEDLDICGETGREFDCGQSRVKGCGKKITEDDENIMIGNISYCCECGEKEEEEEYQWWGSSYSDESGNTISFFNATEKWIEENAEYKYNEYGQLECFKDMR